MQNGDRTNSRPMCQLDTPYHFSVFREGIDRPTTEGDTRKDEKRRRQKF